MTNTDAEQLLKAIIEQAENAPSKFRFIYSWKDFIFCHKQYKSTKLVIKVLNEASKNLFNAYCKTVTTGISDVTQLLAFAQLGDVIDFYKNELKTLGNMLDEYEEYLWNGNFIYALMGGERY